jgi:hypothetical protein
MHLDLVTTVVPNSFSTVVDLLLLLLLHHPHHQLRLH